MSSLISAFHFQFSAFEPRSSFYRVSGSDEAVCCRCDRLYVQLPKGREEVRVLGKQLLRSGTSVAPHVREASRARSEDEFVSKLGGALQEADESGLWLELLREECGIDPGWTNPLEAEASELMAIITTIIKKTKNKAED